MGRVIHQPAEIPEAISAAPERPACTRVLMASPEHFCIEAAINPWMESGDGLLNEIDPKQATRQWNDLRAAYARIGVVVEVISAPPGLPDFCFAANQSLVFSDGQSDRVILSRMAADSRRPEVAHYERWFTSHGFRVDHLPSSVARFEGTGDAIAHPGRRLYWGGIGPRTAATAWHEVARITGHDVIPLTLQDGRFYHLDTCFCPLDADSALYVPAAFDELSCARLESAFSNLHPVSQEDAKLFACNAHCPDMRHVLLQQGAVETVAWLLSAGFQPVELDTSEFMKSGGSVFCLKQELP